MIIVTQVSNDFINGHLINDQKHQGKIICGAINYQYVTKLMLFITIS